MYKKVKPIKTSIELNQCIEGETIEQKVDRITTNREPIADGAPIIYTDRKDGVQPAYNIRTDRFELAVDAMDVVTKSALAKRQQYAEMKVVKDDGGAEPIQGTGTIE